MTPEEVLPGVRTVLSFLNNNGIKLAIGSASRNAQTILKATELSDYFDEIVDGNDVKNAKPDPEVFFTAAKRISVEPRKCVVFEDSRAGCLAAKTAQMYCVGIGERVKLPEADTVIKGFVDFDMVKIIDA